MENFNVRSFSLLLISICTVAFYDILFGVGCFGYRDFALFGLPLADFHRSSFWSGEIPFWNPYNNRGLPFLAQWNSLVFYPLSVLYVIFPLGWALSAFCVAHLILAGVGMYLLVMRLTRNEVAATLAGMGFAFNGLTLNCLMWPNNIAGLSWMPWVVDVLLLPRCRLAVVLGALIAAIQFLSGAPEIIIFTWLAAVLVVGLKGDGSFGRRLCDLLCKLSIALLLVSFQLLPFGELLWLSDRGTKYTSFTSPMPGWGWANLLVPAYHTVASPDGVRFQPNQVWTSSIYCTIPTSVLALSTAWIARSKLTLCALGFCYVSLLIALGNNNYVYPLLNRVFPPINTMNFLAKFVVPTVFFIPILAAVALHQLTASRTSELFTHHLSRIRGLFIIVASLVVAICTVGYYAPLFPGEKELLVYNGAARIAVLVAFYCWLKLWFLGGDRKSTLLTHVVLSLLVFVDIQTHSVDQNPRVALSVYKPDRLLAERLTPLPQIGNSRAMISGEAHNRMLTDALLSCEDMIIVARKGLFCNLNLIDGIPKLDGFFSLYTKEQSFLNRSLYASSRSQLDPLLDFLGVSHMTAKESTTNWVYRDSGMSMITAGQEVVFQKQEDIKSDIFQATFYPLKQVLLPHQAFDRVGTRIAASVRVKNTQVRANALTFETEAEISSIAVIAQTFYPNWRAYCDGREVVIEKANFGFMAIPLPAGQHVIEVTYDDKAFQCGAIVSAISLFFVVGIWIQCRLAVR